MSVCGWTGLVVFLAGACMRADECVRVCTGHARM